MKLRFLIVHRYFHNFGIELLSSYFKRKFAICNGICNWIIENVDNFVINYLISLIGFQYPLIFKIKN